MDGSVSRDKEDVLDDSLVFPFEYLPDLVLDHIFSYLPISDKINAEYVSKLWFYLSRRSWAHVKEFDTSWIKYPHLPLEDGTKVRVFRSLLQRMCLPTGVTTLKKLNIDMRFRMAENLIDAYQAVCKLCPGLVSLCIEEGESVPFAKMILVMFGFEEEDVSPRRCGQWLRHLTLTGIHYIPHNILGEVFRLCPKLESLVLDDFYTFDGVPLPSGDASSRGSESGRGLVNLTVSNSLLSDKFFDSLRRSFSATTLKVLHLDFCRQVTSEGWLKMGQIFAHGQLEYLSLKNSVKDVDFEQFFNRGINNLRYLDLSLNGLLSDQAVGSMLRCLPVLEGLSLMGCESVTNLLPYLWFLHGPFANQFDSQLVVRRERHAPLRLDVSGTRMSQQPKRKNFAWTFNFDIKKLISIKQFLYR